MSHRKDTGQRQLPFFLSPSIGKDKLHERKSSISEVSGKGHKQVG